MALSNRSSTADGAVSITSALLDNEVVSVAGLPDDVVDKSDEVVMISHEEPPLITKETVMCEDTTHEDAPLITKETVMSEDTTHEDAPLITKETAVDEDTAHEDAPVITKETVMDGDTAHEDARVITKETVMNGDTAHEDAPVITKETVMDEDTTHEDAPVITKEHLDIITEIEEEKKNHQVSIGQCSPSHDDTVISKETLHTNGDNKPAAELTPSTPIASERGEVPVINGDEPTAAELTPSTPTTSERGEVPVINGDERTAAELTPSTPTACERREVPVINGETGNGDELTAAELTPSTPIASERGAVPVINGETGNGDERTAAELTPSTPTASERGEVPVINGETGNRDERTAAELTPSTPTASERGEVPVINGETGNGGEHTAAEITPSISTALVSEEISVINGDGTPAANLTLSTSLTASESGGAPVISKEAMTGEAVKVTFMPTALAEDEVKEKKSESDADISTVSLQADDSSPLLSCEADPVIKEEIIKDSSITAAVGEEEEPVSIEAEIEVIKGAYPTETPEVPGMIGLSPSRVSVVKMEKEDESFFVTTSGLDNGDFNHLDNVCVPGHDWLQTEGVAPVINEITNKTEKDSDSSIEKSSGFLSSAFVEIDKDTPVPSKGEASLISTADTPPEVPSSPLSPDGGASLIFTANTPSESFSCPLMPEGEAPLISLADETSVGSPRPPLPEESIPLISLANQSTDGLNPFFPNEEEDVSLISLDNESSLLPMGGVSQAFDEQSLSLLLLAGEDAPLISFSDDISENDPTPPLSLKGDAPVLSTIDGNFSKGDASTTDENSPKGDTSVISISCENSLKGDTPVIPATYANLSEGDAPVTPTTDENSWKGDAPVTSTTNEPSIDDTDHAVLPTKKVVPVISDQSKVENGEIDSQLFKAYDSADSDQELTNTEPCTETTSMDSTSEEEEEEDNDVRGQSSESRHSNNHLPNTLSQSPSTSLPLPSLPAGEYTSALERNTSPSDEGGRFGDESTNYGPKDSFKLLIDNNYNDISQILGTPAAAAAEEDKDGDGIRGICSSTPAPEPAQVAGIDRRSANNKGESPVCMYVCVYV